jgi:hypothetical protein
MDETDFKADSNADFERRYPLDDATYKRIFPKRGILKEVAEARPHVPYAQGDPEGKIPEYAGWGDEQKQWIRDITRHSGGIIMVRNPALPATAPKTGNFWEDEEAGWGTHGAPIPAEIRPDEPVIKYHKPHAHPPTWTPDMDLKWRDHLNNPPEDGDAPKKLRGLWEYKTLYPDTPEEQLTPEQRLTEREQYDLCHEDPETRHSHVDPAKYIHPTNHFPEYFYPGWIPLKAFTGDLPRNPATTRVRAHAAAWRKHLAEEFPGKTFTPEQEWKRWHKGWKRWLESEGYAKKFRYTTASGREVVTDSPKKPPWLKALGPRGRVVDGAWKPTRELTKEEKFHSDRYKLWASWHQRRRRHADLFPQARRLDMNPSKRARQLFEDACNGGVLYFVLEGCLKADAVLSAGAAAVSVPAVGQWHTPDLELFAEKVRGAARVVVLTDSDWNKTPEVHRAATECVAWFRAHGVNAFHGAPDALPDLPKTGIDDWLDLTATPRRSLDDIGYPVRKVDEQECRDAVIERLAEYKSEHARNREAYPSLGVKKDDIIRAHWWFVHQLRAVAVGASYSKERLAKFMSGKVRVDATDRKRAQRARAALERLGLIQLMRAQTFASNGVSIAPVYDVCGFTYYVFTVTQDQLCDAL